MTRADIDATASAELEAVRASRSPGRLSWVRVPTRASTRVLVATLAIAVLPHLVVMGRALVSGWTPSGDQAMEILRMHDVGTADTPLLGPYSRFGWDHPGPLLFWLGAPALRLAGPVGVMLLIGVLNIAATIAAVAAARRLAGDAFALLVTACVAVMVHSHGAVKLVDPWNPWVTVLPLLSYLFCVPVAVVHRSRWALAGAVVAGSFVAQSHLGNLPVVLAAAASGAAWWWFERSRIERPTGATDKPLSAWWLVGLLVLLWAGPLADVVVHAPGNVWNLAEFALGSTEEPAPLGESLGAAARELGFVPAWAGAHEGVWPVEAAPVWTLLILPAALIAGAVAGRSQAHLSPTRPAGLVGYTLVVYVAAAFAVTRTTGGLIPYVLRWTWPVAIVATCVALLPALRAIERLPGSRRAVAEHVITGLMAGLVVVASLAAVRGGIDNPVEPSPHTDRSVGPLSAAIRDVLPAGDYALEWFDVRSFSAISIGTGVDLTRHGYGIDFPTDHASRVGEFRAAGRTDLPLLLIVGHTPAEFFIPPDGAERIVEWDHLSERDRRLAEELETRIRLDAGIEESTLVAVDTAAARNELADAGADVADVDALHEIGGDRESYEVWLAPAGTPRSHRG